VFGGSKFSDVKSSKTAKVGKTHICIFSVFLPYQNTILIGEKNGVLTWAPRFKHTPSFKRKNRYKTPFLGFCERTHTYILYARALPELTSTISIVKMKAVPFEEKIFKK